MDTSKCIEKLLKERFEKFAQKSKKIVEGSERMDRIYDSETEDFVEKIVPKEPKIYKNVPAVFVERKIADFVPEILEWLLEEKKLKEKHGNNPGFDAIDGVFRCQLREGFSIYKYIYAEYHNLGHDFGSPFILDHPSPKKWIEEKKKISGTCVRTPRDFEYTKKFILKSGIGNALLTDKFMTRGDLGWQPAIKSAIKC